MAKREISDERIECRVTRSDGSIFLASIAMNPIDDGAGRELGYLALVVDVTEQRKMQEQLMVSDRMASVGTLAAGVAHEINNPLAAVLGNLHLAASEVERLAKDLPDEQTRDLREELSDALEGSRRIRDIVRDLKIFSRSQQASNGPVDIHAILESSLRMAWNEIRHCCSVVRDFGEVPSVEGNESRLGQVFLNLITNAMQAMEEGQVDKNEMRITTRSDELGRVVVEIRDTGGGMAPEVLRQLFTPFFTTKTVGIGTGLGLSICHRIVTNMGGEIVVDSVPGQGSRFRVALPRAGSEITRRPGSQPVELPVPRRARILVIDDEAVIGNTVRRIMGTDHEVNTLTDAREALEQLASGIQYDIILCDLMMPQVTGMELHDELLVLDAAQAERMIFLTGGAFTPAAQQFLSDGSIEYIEKPFDSATLRAVVQRHLRAQG